MSYYDKGEVIAVHSGLTATATSSEFVSNGYNAMLVEVIITGSGSWTISLQGSSSSGGTFSNVYDNNKTQQTTGSISASRIQLFTVTPDFMKIVATEDSGTATCSVNVIPVNV